MGGQPQSTWVMISIHDPAEALKAMEKLVARDPIAYSLVADIAATLVEDPNRYPEHEWFQLKRGAAAELMAMHTPPVPIFLPKLVRGGVEHLALTLAEAGHELAGVNGSRDAVEAFLETYLPRTQRTVTDQEALGQFDLPVEPRLPWPVEGEYRIADASEAELLTGWAREFWAETGVFGAGGDPHRAVLAHIRRQRLHLWAQSGRPVSMCWISPPQAGVVRVAGVYTPRESRGHGYASAVVAAASTAEQQAGNLCTLFTQLSNPTSNRIYQALGYRRIGEHLNTKLS
jgi:predicted GNAT family acetyltransferase